MIGLMMLAAVATCPGGPLFAFKPGTATFTSQAERIIPGYLPLLQSPLWRAGWFTVEPVSLDVATPETLRLIRAREHALVLLMTASGIARSRIRFAPPRAAHLPDDALWIDAYTSTLSVSQTRYDRFVAPGVLC